MIDQDTVPTPLQFPESRTQRRMVLAHPNGIHQICGLWDGPGQPPSLLDDPDVPNALPVCLVAVKRSYYLYKPLMVPATVDITDPRPVFDRSQR